MCCIVCMCCVECMCVLCACVLCACVYCVHVCIVCMCVLCACVYCVHVLCRVHVCCVHVCVVCMYVLCTVHVHVCLVHGACDVPMCCALRSHLSAPLIPSSPTFRSSLNWNKSATILLYTILLLPHLSSSLTLSTIWSRTDVCG